MCHARTARKAGKIGTNDKDGRQIVADRELGCHQADLLRHI
jgi:hypothetical protein